MIGREGKALPYSKMLTNNIDRMIGLDHGKTLVLLTFRPANCLLLGGTVLCFIGCLPVSLASTHAPIYDNQKYLQTLPGVLWGPKSCWLRTTEFDSL